MDCNKITTSLRKLLRNDSVIVEIFKSNEIEGIDEVKENSLEVMIGVLSRLKGYKYEIAHRDLVSAKEEFNFVSSFSEGLGFAEKGRQTFLIDDKGEIINHLGHIIETYPFANGSAVVVRREVEEPNSSGASITHKLFYLIDHLGNNISGPYDDLHGTGREHILAFVDEDQTIDPNNFHSLVYVERSGRIMKDISPITPFSENRAWIRDMNSGDLILIDNEFNEIAQRHGVFATPVSCGRSWVNLGGTMYDLVDEKGEPAMEGSLNLAYVSKFADNLSLVSRGNTQSPIFGVCDKNGRITDIPQARSEEPSEGKISFVYSISRKYGFFDPKSGSTSKESYLYASPFSEGLARVIFEDRSYGFIDHDYKEVFGRFKEALSFKDGVALVVKEGKKYYIDHQGNRVFG